MCTRTTIPAVRSSYFGGCGASAAFCGVPVFGDNLAFFPEIAGDFPAGLRFRSFGRSGYGRRARCRPFLAVRIRRLKRKAGRKAPLSGSAEHRPPPWSAHAKTCPSDVQVRRKCPSGGACYSPQSLAFLYSGTKSSYTSSITSSSLSNTSSKAEARRRYMELLMTAKSSYASTFAVL